MTELSKAPVDGIRNLEEKINHGRMLGSLVMGEDVELTDRESLLVYTVYGAGYRDGVESTEGRDFSNNEKVIISAVQDEMARRHAGDMGVVNG